MKVNISHKNIIILTYLTNYNIRVIKDYISLYNNFDVLLEVISKNFNYTDKAILEAKSKACTSIDKLKYHDIQSISIYDDNYPKLVKRIADAPPILYYKGQLRDCDLSAIVGSRNVSKHANKITSEITDWLNEVNHGVVSGLALGIDSFAHKRALLNNQYTVAVLPNSLDSIYPSENYDLANQILDKKGCLISEMIFNINRGKRSFVQRNRIQSALSQAVIPIEMGINSGTMHTINFAKKYGKKIMLFNPTPMLKDMNEYEGILHLINNPHKNQRIFNNKEEFILRINSSLRDSQIGMNFD